MKKWNYIIALLIISGSILAQSPIPSYKPSKAQKMLIKRGYGMFIHFGVNTFTNDEWSDGSIPASSYNPTELDCDQWIRVARDAGFRYVLLTTKHHDGFCLWDSKYTDYDVASSPVKTDVVAEVAKACKKYGLKFAVYYSLWDRHEPSYKNVDKTKYIEYMKNQLTELMTNYGEVVELWFDGGWDRKPEEWSLPEVYSLVKKLQPNCVIGVNHTIVYEEGKRRFVNPDFMTEDDKYFFQYFPGDFRLWDPKIANLGDKKQYLHNGQSYYLPFEHTLCISKPWSWFQKSSPLPTRDLDELEELFYWATSNNNTMILDIPPAPNGKIYEHEANTAISLAQRIGIKKGKALPKNGKFISYHKPVTASSTETGDPKNSYLPSNAVDGAMQSRWSSKDTLAELVIDLNPVEKFNKISIFEYQDTKDGNDGFSNYRTNRIQAYNIEILKDGKWTAIFHDQSSMGDCKVIHFPLFYQTSKLKLKVLKASAPPSIYEINIIDFSKR